MSGIRHIGSGWAVFGRCLALIAVLALALSPLTMHRSGFDDHNSVEISVDVGSKKSVRHADEREAAEECHPATVCSAAIVAEPVVVTGVFNLAAAKAEIRSELRSGLAALPVTKPPIS